MLRKSMELFKFKEWLSDKKRLMDSSIYTYNTVMRMFFVEVDDIDDIEKYNWFLVKYSHKKRCSYFYSVLKAYIEFRFGNNPNMLNEWTKNLLKPKRYKDIKVERKYLTDDKLIGILNNLEFPKHKIMALIQIFGASRANDVFSITKDDISEETYDNSPTLKIVTLGKGDKKNVVYIFDPVGVELIKSYLAYYKKETLKFTNNYYLDYIFITKGNIDSREGSTDNLFMMKKMNYLRYWIDLKNAIEKSGVVNKKFFATHDFRRCFARKAWEKYKDIDVLRRILNHEDASTTLRYLRQSGLQNIDIFKDLQS